MLYELEVLGLLEAIKHVEVFAMLVEEFGGLEIEFILPLVPAFTLIVCKAKPVVWASALRQFRRR